ncbi:adenosylcobinamide-phosphate synthase CbiB [Marinicrinis lubricantis]|uniref:Cobalamin biosynthesis protein CobD n=1 Tax=Marinicrinis lubricantis TaxID=2086470 RepID=A0ABW1IRL5_9BACL
MIGFYSLQEILMITALAIIVDLLIGDPKRLPHPVIWIGKLIKFLTNRWLNPLLSLPPVERQRHQRKEKQLGIALLVTVALSVFIVTVAGAWACAWIHPWLGYAFQVWFISTTMAVKGLKDAGVLVFDALDRGRLHDARTYVGYIVGRDTMHLDEPEITRAAVETVAENTVDAYVTPLCFALLGGAPLAMLYRAVNTLDSMVGYRNEKYRHFGWASARCDDVLNYIPARLTGLLMVLSNIFLPGSSAGRSLRAILKFARLHPSPNGGIPESAAAGALGVQLGGINVYGEVVSDRARMGWKLRELRSPDILAVIRMLYGTAYLTLGGILCALCWIMFAGS